MNVSRNLTLLTLRAMTHGRVFPFKSRQRLLTFVSSTFGGRCHPFGYFWCHLKRKGFQYKQFWVLPDPNVYVSRVARAFLRLLDEKILVLQQRLSLAITDTPPNQVFFSESKWIRCQVWVWNAARIWSHLWLHKSRLDSQSTLVLKQSSEYHPSYTSGLPMGWIRKIRSIQIGR